MSECALSASISSLSLLLVHTQAVRWKAAAPEQLTCAHLYLDIAKSGYHFHDSTGGMKMSFRQISFIAQHPRAMTSQRKLQPAMCLFQNQIGFSCLNIMIGYRNGFWWVHWFNHAIYLLHNSIATINDIFFIDSEVAIYNYADNKI